MRLVELTSKIGPMDYFTFFVDVEDDSHYQGGEIVPGSMAKEMLNKHGDFNPADFYRYSNNYQPFPMLGESPEMFYKRIKEFRDERNAHIEAVKKAWDEL